MLHLHKLGTPQSATKVDPAARHNIRVMPGDGMKVALNHDERALRRLSWNEFDAAWPPESVKDEYRAPLKV